MTTMNSPYGLFLKDNFPTTFIESHRRVCQIEEHLTSSYPKNVTRSEQLTQSHAVIKISQGLDLGAPSPKTYSITRRHLDIRKSKVVKRDTDNMINPIIEEFVPSHADKVDMNESSSPKFYSITKKQWDMEKVIAVRSHRDCIMRYLKEGLPTSHRSMIESNQILNQDKMVSPTKEPTKDPILDKEQDDLSDNLEDPQIILYTRMYDKKNSEHPPLFITLLIKDLLFHNCMFDLGAYNNVTPLKVMKQLGLEITRSYRNICGIDSRAILMHGIIQDLELSLVEYHDISISMDIVVIDVRDSWGMLISREWVATLGASLQMDLYYATIPALGGGFVILHREIVVRISQ
jgi:hypothetical protein